MACSSSVSKLLAFNGSFQSNDTGVVMCRLPMVAERMLAFRGLEACLQSGRSMLSIIRIYLESVIQRVNVMVQSLRLALKPDVKLALGSRKGPRLVGDNAAVVATELNPRFCVRGNSVLHVLRRELMST